MVGLFRRAALTALLVAFMAAPASATITVSVVPTNQIAILADGTATVEIFADIPEADATVGWGFDLDLTGLSATVNSVEVNDALFDAVAAVDGDDLAGLADFPGTAVFNDPGAVLLATVTLNLVEEGVTLLDLSDDNPEDLSEGFALDPPPVGAFADVVYVGGSITVIPEPATIGLLAVLAVGLVRRRR